MKKSVVDTSQGFAVATIRNTRIVVILATEAKAQCRQSLQLDDFQKLPVEP